jgi:hypothetical protein
MPNYSIEARSLDIAGVASHDFLVLRDEQGNAVAELHGLATDRESGKVVPIGTDEDRYSLRVWHYPHDDAYASSLDVPASRTTYIRDGQDSVTVLTADKTEVMERWQAAVDAAQQLNALDLDYPDYGFRVFGDTVNSNSAYRTLSEIMGVPVQDFPGRMEPGLDNRMVPEKTIEALRTHAYPALDRPSIERNGTYVPLGAQEHGDRARDRHKSASQPEDPLFGQVRDGVQRIDASLGRAPDAASERMTWSLYALAKERGMEQVDDVALGRAGTRAAAGEYVFLVQGDPAGSVYRREQMRTADAVEATVERSQARVQIAERTQVQGLVVDTNEPVQQQAQPTLRA